MNLEEVREIFSAALEYTDAAEREEFLDKACQGMPGIREEVHRFLSAHDQAGSFMNDPLARGDSTESDGAGEPLGTVIGPYKLLQKIGEGGFGAVYMAEQTKPIMRRVALKIIKPGMDTKQVIGRFEVERQALAMMDHPNIAKVLDAGTTDKGRPYFIMELVRGVPITKYCDQAKLSIEERLKLFMQICHAVQHAHQKGIIHRDLKPANILVTLHDGVPVPKVIDFGIAKAVQQKLTDFNVFTLLEQFVGTPAYMSPEQAEMSGLDVDIRSDIYSLGVILYELLTGRPPFDGKDLIKEGVDSMRRRLREEEPPKASMIFSTLTQQERTKIATQRGAEVKRLSEILRSEADWIIMKAMEKDRTRRYETVTDLRQDIERYINGLPVEAVAPSLLYVASKYVRRNRFWVSVGAAGVVLLAASSFTFSNLADHYKRESQRLAQQVIDKETQRADAEQQRAEGNARLARQHQYVSDIKAAHHYVDTGNYKAAKDVLNSYQDDGEIEDVRGWEWYYLYSQLGGDSIEQIEFDSPSESGLAISQDGNWVATACRDNTIRIWDRQRKTQIASLPRDTNLLGPVKLYFSESSQLLVALVLLSNSDYSHRISIQMWAIDGEKFETIDNVTLPGGIDLLDYSPSKNLLVGRVHDESISIYQLPEMEEISSVPISAPTTVGGQYAFSPDGEYVVGPGENEMIVVIESKTGKLVRNCPVPTPLVPFRQPVFDADGKRIIFSAVGSPAYEWVWTDQETPRLLDIDLRRVNLNTIAFSPDGRWFVTRGQDYLIHAWNAETFQYVRNFKGNEEHIQSIGFIPDSELFVSSVQDGPIKIWDMSDSSPEETISGMFFTGGFPVFSPDSRYLTLMKATFNFRNSEEIKSDVTVSFQAHGVVSYDLNSQIETLLDQPVNCLGFNKKGDRFFDLGAQGVDRLQYPMSEIPVSELNTHALNGELISRIELQGLNSFTSTEYSSLRSQ